MPHAVLAAALLLAAAQGPDAPVVSRALQGADPAGPGSTSAPSAPPGEAGGELTPRLNEAVERGLAALARLQRDDGSFGEGNAGGNVAVTSLACLAFMADGNTPGRGPYGEVVAKGLDHVLRCVEDSGLIAGPAATGPMYGHGFSTVFLGEIYGMTGGGADTQVANRVHQALVRSVRLIEGTQNDEGGWRYNPVPYDADVSVTICQVMALRAARNAGLETNKKVIDKAVEYVRSCQNPDGGFRYQSMQGGSAWPRSAAGVATLYYAGIYEDRAIDAGLKYLGNDGSSSRQNGQQIHYWYGQYYTGQAMFLAGGDHWSTWWPIVRREVMDRQNSDGLWEDTSWGNAYGTAMALIVLQMPKRYLPIFQK